MSQRAGTFETSELHVQSVATAAHAYEEAVKAFVYTYQGKLPAWMAKLPFEPLKRKAKRVIERSQEAKQSFERSKQREKESSCSRAKAELIKAALEIGLNHRLPRP